ncbi:type II secretion system F family protein [Methyloligella sp. 2.7D]|uniref:type II secretion system F family protein n=1 Tax=unclassified Methyloligella TaxID=2625955 RepID=UPI00157D50FA|nr:type II secretion system F family protein [Methyloligella sp. GL2]QKP78584.1 type II secretion system F family protein [Methyloligella sp. GL2]
MVSPELLQIAIIGLAALAVGGIAYALLSPYFSSERQVNKRVANVSQGTTQRRIQQAAKQPAHMRRQQVQETVKELEAQQRADKRISLRTRLRRAGLTISPRVYYLLCVAAGLFGGLVVALVGAPLWTAVLAIFVFGVGLPRWVLGKMTTRHQAKFLREFANAIDIIVRGVKTGLPLSDCLLIIASEAPEPVKSAFVELVEQQKVGVPLGQGFQRMYERMPLQEVNFLSTVIGIQSQAGGNLAEALGNLSQVLRDRYQLQAKVKALSAEAKASAWIIGALPPLVALAVFFTTPGYMDPLVTERMGNIILIGAGLWMLTGILIMRKMINFEY